MRKYIQRAIFIIIYNPECLEGRENERKRRLKQEKGSIRISNLNANEAILPVWRCHLNSYQSCSVKGQTRDDNNNNDGEDNDDAKYGKRERR